MTLTDTDSQILKTDTRGRVVTSSARRESLLDEFERSGLSGAKFATVVGVKYPTFAAWVQQRRRQRAPAVSPPAAAPPGAAVRWLEAVVGSAPPSGSAATASLILHLPGGTRIEIAHAGHVPLAVALLRALTPATAPC